MEAIILAGGLGTRLRSEVKDVPKPMALIQDRPFMEYLLDHLIAQGVRKVIFSVGYKSEFIQNHFGEQYANCEIKYAFEEKRLGTGGAIKNAMQFVEGSHVLVTNGDSIIFSDLKAQFKTHQSSNADVTLGLKEMQNFERYGSVTMDAENRIVEFLEKQPIDIGYINTGTYFFNVKSFKKQDLPEIFSIEKDFFELKIKDLKIIGFPAKGYFLDIGIPEDFRKAQYEIGIFRTIDTSWNLILDWNLIVQQSIKSPSINLTGPLEGISRLFGKLIILRPISNEDESTFQKQLNEIFRAKDIELVLISNEAPLEELLTQQLPSLAWDKTIMVNSAVIEDSFSSAKAINQIVINEADIPSVYTQKSLERLRDLLVELLA